VAAGDLELLERGAVDREMRGDAHWWGFHDVGSVRRRFETDGFLGQDDGLLIVEAGGEAIGLVTWHAVHHGQPPWSRGWNMGIALLPEWRGRGYGGPARRALAEYLLATTTALRVEASTQGLLWVVQPERQSQLRYAGPCRCGQRSGASCCGSARAPVFPSGRSASSTIRAPIP
jgi:GNAT superfamily N-acetyltransferase